MLTTVTVKSSKIDHAGRNRTVFSGLLLMCQETCHKANIERHKHLIGWKAL